MLTLSSVVEGFGEVEALPILLRRLATWLGPVAVRVLPPVRVSRSKLIKQGELERAVHLASWKAEGGAVIVLLDADDDCPATFAPQLLARATEIAASTKVVLAKSEFESWFIAAASSISGCRGLRGDLEMPPSPEEIRDAKGWLRRNMADHTATYSETLDQPALASLFDLSQARAGSVSFDKLCRDVEAIIADRIEPAESL